MNSLESYVNPPTKALCDVNGSCKKHFIIIFIISVTALGSFGQTPLDDPGEYNGSHPFDLSEAVYAAGSDATSKNFQSSHLPNLLDFVNENTGERKVLSDESAFSLLPQSITLAESTDVRAYFLSEGAGYRNTLGVTTTSAQTGVSEDLLLFPNTSTLAAEYSSNTETRRSSRAPLLPGDFVDLGTMSMGDELDMFLIANGSGGGTLTYSANAATNPDLLPHVVAGALPGSPFLLVSFEDLYGGGDRDYNDLVIALNIGAANVNALLGNPEPETIALILVLAGLLWALERRERSKKFRSAHA